MIDYSFPRGTEKVFRKFHKFDAVNNNNKIWQLTAVLRSDGQYNVKYEFGRVRENSKLQSVSKVQSHTQVHSKMDEQVRKDGYTPLELEVESAVVAKNVTLTGRVGEIVRLILDEANIGISQYLATNIDRLSSGQIMTARDIVTAISLARTVKEKRDLVSAFYSTIPTQLPAKIDIDELVQQFNADQQRERLAQLGAAVQFTAASNQGSIRDLIGADIEYLPETDEAYQWALDSAKANTDKSRNNGDPCNHKIVIQAVYKILIPKERNRFENSKRGKSVIKRLTHGTWNENVAHILRDDGLLIEKSKSGIFGHGIYGASYMGKSCDFTKSFGQHAPRMMFLADFAVGNAYVAPTIHKYQAPPSGYDSVWAKRQETERGYGRKIYQDEHIVYHNEQCTITHLVVGSWRRQNEY